MKKIVKKYVFYINAVNYTLFELYADKAFLFSKVKDIILPTIYKDDFNRYKHGYSLKRYNDMQFFEAAYSPSVFVILSTPISLFFAKLMKCILQYDTFYVYIFFELLLTFPIWKCTLNEKEDKRQFRMYERLSKRYLRCWRLLLLSIIILDIFLIILLNLM